MRVKKSYCIKCGTSFDFNHGKQYCGLECFLKDFTYETKPKYLIADETPCMIWKGDVDQNNNPVVVHGDKVVKVRDQQITLEPGKRLNVICGNSRCLNKNHYEIVDDFSEFGYL